MFITNFKQMLTTLPTEADGYDSFVQHLQDEHQVIQPAKEFLARITDYSFNKLRIPITTADHNPHIMLAAFTMTRFPIEALSTPEKPLHLTLLNKALSLLLAIDRILHEHHPAEDDSADDFLSAATATRFLGALGEYRSAWAVWWAAGFEEMKRSGM